MASSCFMQAVKQSQEKGLLSLSLKLWHSFLDKNKSSIDISALVCVLILDCRLHTVFSHLVSCAPDVRIAPRSFRAQSSTRFTVVLKSPVIHLNALRLVESHLFVFSPEINKKHLIIILFGH